MTHRAAVIAWAGGILGRALATEFSSGGYSVTGLRRSVEAQGGQNWREIACVLSNPEDCRSVVEAIAAAESAPVEVLILNAAHLSAAPFLELKYEHFEACWRACVAGAIGCLQGVLPAMLKRARGTIIFSGATASTRGSAGFAAFAAAKFALRGLAQSLAREYHPHGVHVAHVVLDGLVRGSPSVSRFGGREDRTLCPEEVARMYRLLCEQPRSSWTHELDFRPAEGTF
jgi:NAD(P)-dependent dehydrogenase (short-subunit alcohol dehydrogenase family)